MSPRPAIRSRWGGVAVAVAAVLAVAVMARGGEQEAFPHEEHAGLFPLCTGCHEGVPEGDEATFYPAFAQCQGCHDGVDLDSVRWSPPPVDEAEPIRFTHPGHIDAVSDAGDPELACVACHTAEGAPRMAVRGELVVERCFACHAHPAEDHFVDAECQVCHPSAAETAMASEWLGRLPTPADHVTSEFLPERHGELAGADPARCATCHTQERCASCHVDAERVAEIGDMPAAPPSLELPRFAAHYVAPPSHQAPDFASAHGKGATAQTCATCHTRDDCAACHAGAAPAVVATLPDAADVMAPGVLLQRRTPSNHEPAGFLEDHGTLAAAAPSTCTSCHTRTMCSDCHQAAGVDATALPALAGPQFHPTNYMARHSAEAYGRRLECSSCHDTGAFCRDCHQQAGFEATGRLGPGFHDAEPLWLLRHGAAARQALESCATCHEQRDCLQCHSTVGSFQVNPHGDGWSPEAARKRNPGICLVCHITTPGGG